jgi:predicted CopG family antitoxin
MDDEREEYKSIKVYESTYNRLLENGRMQESFDDLINRLLDDFEDSDDQ